MKLKDAVVQVKGIGPKMAEKLGRLGIYTVEDLITYFPRRYQDWSKITKMEDIVPDQETAVYGRVVDVHEYVPRFRMSIVTVVIVDSTGAVNLTYFNQSWKKQEFKQGDYVLAYGRVEYNYRKYQMSNADTVHVSPEELPHWTKLVPVYALTDGIRMNQLSRFIQTALAGVEDIHETIPEEVRKKEGLQPIKEAVEAMHHPQNWNDQARARKTLAFEELFYMQVGLALLKRKRSQKVISIKCAPSGALVHTILSRLPFKLTEGQKEAFQDIEDDMEGLVPMRRLIQGDVGSGKTVVAALALAKIAENGYQGVLMAPTEVLASQHFETMKELFHDLPVKIAYLSGATKPKEREKILEGLLDGSIQILIGTHALIEKDVVFAHLGLVITDEQHRFGVKQRQALENKGEDPHILVMTATPIPRTMALSVYGDLDVSSIRTMPAGRQIVKTYVINASYLQRVFNFMKREMNAGHQVYVVCPMVKESEAKDLASAEAIYKNLKTKIFPSYHVGLVHGQMKNEEKEQIMKDFQEGKIQLLVATSVIEVGINVPNATIMFIFGADRFGLSQLHQLRGRVGRGKAQSYCILYSKNQNETTQTRLRLITQIHDGFLLAEKDLLLRGSGEFFGVHQHGLNDLKVADLIKDLPLMVEAKKEAGIEVSRGFTGKEELKSRFKGRFYKEIWGN